MVLADHRAHADPVLVPLAERLHARGVRPDHLTWSALGVAFLAGAAFLLADPGRPWPLVAGGVLVAVNALLDGLDGKMARTFGRASDRGDYLDHAIDRFADVFILGGLTFSPFVTDRIGLVAIVGVLLTSYLGTQAQAAGLGRDLGGLLGRADRLALLAVVPVVEVLLLAADVTQPWTAFLTAGPLVLWSLIDALMLVIALLAALTVVQRFVRGLGGFSG